MSSKRGLTRLAFFIVFFIPVAWYLFLQLFGNNQFVLEVKYPIKDNCPTFDKVTIVYSQDSLSVTKRNYFNRVLYKTKGEKRLVLDTINFISCVGSSSDLILVNQEGIWGEYEMSREGVDRLLTELDILILQKSYGTGSSR